MTIGKDMAQSCSDNPLLEKWEVTVREKPRILELSSQFQKTLLMYFCCHLTALWRNMSTAVFAVCEVLISAGISENSEIFWSALPCRNSTVYHNALWEMGRKTNETSVSVLKYIRDERSLK